MQYSNTIMNPEEAKLRVEALNQAHLRSVLPRGSEGATIAPEALYLNEIYKILENHLSRLIGISDEQKLLIEKLYGVYNPAPVPSLEGNATGILDNIIQKLTHIDIATNVLLYNHSQLNRLI